ncbi:RNA-DNA hybrid ribonuclease [Aspergillus glaucus CBS 516.65]|uniref:Ribonuclease H n=1 Tax=Aspergillus glaucus CBS 516.65 TaxID=1160497 RepID=A0A1L9VZS0_ASPGL|nr:hypothetical protein ASPGLDRAFT_239138 [Aspergillus glaucus CBS 516.65]OJJ89423.1 hypothetical protein ASPGLDRAFT_239138 [Aspergillus glaucus CBS 516.65]
MMGTSTTTPSPSPAPAMKPSPAASAAGTKRKRNTPGKYYAVKKGYQPGVYFEWNDCLTQVTGYKGAVFQAFSTIEEASSFLRGTKAPLGVATRSDSVHTRFYGIQRGRLPGVYTDWAQAQEQIRGFQRPSYRKFSTRTEAEEFVKMGQQSGASFASDSTKTQKLSGAPGMMDEIPKDEHGVPYEAADGPLGLDAEDGFDPNVLLDPKTGKAVYRLPEQKTVTKVQAKGPPGMLRIYTDGSSLANGRAVASAGVGVYFGPGDSRNVSEPLKGNRQTNQRAELTAILRTASIQSNA